MSEKEGIDVSTFQGTIDWSQVATEKSFVIVRAGYGNRNQQDTHIDPRARSYISGAREYNIAIAGIYWYTYATSPQYTRIEAQRACQFLREEGINVPVFFDYELHYEGGTATPDEVRAIATAFINEVINQGFTAGIYFDPNYYSNYYGQAFIDELRNRCKIWYASWYVQQPTINCDIWQYSDSGTVAGITGNVDLNKLINGNLYFKTEYVIKTGTGFYLLTDDTWARGNQYLLFVNYFDRVLKSGIKYLYIEPTHYSNNTPSLNRNVIFKIVSTRLMNSNEIAIKGTVHNFTPTIDTSNSYRVTVNNIFYTIPRSLYDMGYAIVHEIGAYVMDILSTYESEGYSNFETLANCINNLRDFRVYWNITDINISEQYNDIHYYFNYLNNYINYAIIIGSYLIEGKVLNYYGVQSNILSIKTNKETYNKFWNYNNFLSDKYIWIDDYIDTIALNEIETNSGIVSLNNYTVPQTVIYGPNNGYLLDEFTYSNKPIKTKKLQPIYYSRVF